MRRDILIVDKMHPSILEMLADIGLKADYEPNINREEILSKISTYEGLIIRSKTTVNREFIDRAKSLKFVARAGAGIDKLDFDYIREKKIKVFNAPEGNRDAVAEHAMGMLLTLMNQIKLADLQVRGGVWDREGNRGYEVKGKTVGIFGFGYMGAAFAQRLRGFECKVIAYDKYKSGFSTEFVKEVSLEEFQERTDILSLHVPLTPETKFLINREFIDSFSKNIILLNTARGEILPLTALNDLLTSGKVIAAALDVLENEKLNKLSQDQKELYHNIFKRDNVILTPHVAGWTHESYERINEVLVKKIKSYYDVKLPA